MMIQFKMGNQSVQIDQEAIFQGHEYMEKIILDMTLA